ncbi:hypothetical protein CHS0354_027880 [Potamilus streckersoni]|uniref:Uncharacterized protein n=1 Tax=Potamilus streckersoni TaxID=2493646 RepID=A0AAE0T3H2_9BIVA|nr:hypothetical protein CHS0354_027880 [Potamilus streckersoni]
MACCGSASGWVKVACLLLLIALPLHLTGYATVYWLSIYTVAESYAAGIGLWKMENCSSNAYSNPCKTNLNVPASYQTAEFVATQALESIALVFLVFSTLFILLYVMIRRLRTLCMALTVVILCFLTVTFSVIGMILHVTNIPTSHYVNYSFGLTVVAFLLTFLAGILMFADIRRYGLPDSDIASVRPAPEKSKMDEVKNLRYYNEYNRDKDRALDINRNMYYKKEREVFHEKPRMDALHYHNPNIETYENDRFVSPPPSYRSIRTPLSIGRTSRMTVRTDRTLISHVQTPDIYLGRNDLTDVDRPILH